MTALPETSTWTTGVYLVENADFLEGGDKDKKDNVAAQQLACRFLYLKNLIGDVKSLIPPDTTNP